MDTTLGSQREEPRLRDPRTELQGGVGMETMLTMGKYIFQSQDPAKRYSEEKPAGR